MTPPKPLQRMVKAQEGFEAWEESPTVGGLSEGVAPGGASLVPVAISSHLSQLGYPKKSLESMQKCGSYTGFYVNRECSCEHKVIPTRHLCNLRTCPLCSIYRKKRIYKTYMPFFYHFKPDQLNFFHFLTISPPNYQDLDVGLKNIKIKFSKFLRRKYVAERIKAGFYVIECKNTGNGWNIHIHAILYGRRLDYRIRGKCFDCGQNLLKFDKISKVYYCANRNCNSINVKRKKMTKLNNEWYKSNKEVAHIYGEKVYNHKKAINYLLKYISVEKTNFQSSLSFAQYIFSIRRHRLINKFGLFYNQKIKPLANICKNCNEKIFYYFDMEVSMLLIEQQKKISLAEKPPWAVCFFS